MKRRSLTLFGVSALVAGAIACSSANPATPVAPTATGANAAGTASPINDQKLPSSVVTLTARAATLQFASATPITLQYRFQVFNAAGTMVENALASGTTYLVTAT